MKGIDEYSYQIRLVPRKKNSVWSLSAVKYAQQLIKTGEMKKAGKMAFESRNKKRSQTKEPEYTQKQLKLFKSNTKAWEFYTRQTVSYQKYMRWWVASAVREETQMKRLQMLIEDSANGTKLRKILEAEAKYQKKKFPNAEPGKTPIEAAKNIGPVTGAELRNVGFDTLEKLKETGWEEAFEKVCEVYPHRINLNMLVGLIATIEDVDWRKLDPNLKAQARSYLREFKRNLRNF